MRPKKLRFTVGIAIVVGAIIYFAFAGFEEGKAYYRTIDELAMEHPTDGRRLRVAGIVRDGTIEREGTTLRFQIEQDSLTLTVNYTGGQPIPDTFKPGVEAIVEGYLENGVFEADHIQAKCASKYESKYGAKDEKGQDTEVKSY